MEKFSDKIVKGFLWKFYKDFERGSEINSWKKCVGIPEEIPEVLSR